MMHNRPLVIDYLPLLDTHIIDVLVSGLSEEEKLRRELAKQNYLTIHKKRGKR